MYAINMKRYQRGNLEPLMEGRQNYLRFMWFFFKQTKDKQCTQKLHKKTKD